MAFTYDNTLSTDLAKARFRLGDTSVEHPVYTDAEITQFLTDGGSVAGAVAEAQKHQKRVAAWRGDSERVGPIDEALALDGSGMPTLTVSMPAALPMDAGYDETNP